MRPAVILKFVMSVFLLYGSIIYLNAQTISDPSQDPNYDAAKAAQITPSMDIMNKSGVMHSPGQLPDESVCYFPPDSSYNSFYANDDASIGPFTLPFSFDLYGTLYNQVWINNNGNVTFTGSYYSYTATGFPMSMPMVAAFWADVDTRPAGSALTTYQINPTNLIVSWNGVGYYSYQTDKLNTFQLIITNGLDPIIGIGNNVAFFYGDMQWTTGSASGGSGGFNGSPANVGINKGDGVNYVQVGRFGVPGNAYDGPGNNTDGIDYLDNQCFYFNVTSLINQPPSVNGLPPNNTINIACGDTGSFFLTFIAPEVGQSVSTTVNTGGLCNTNVNITNGNFSTAYVTILGAACNEGTHVVSFTATDNYTPPASTTVDVIVNVSACCVPPVISCPPNITVNNDSGQCGAIVFYDEDIINTKSPITVTFSHPSGGFFPVGNTIVTAIAQNDCGVDSCYFTITVIDAEAPQIECPQDIAVSNDSGICGAVVNYTVGSSDNCPGQTLTQTAGLASGEVFPVGTTVNSFLVVDGAGHMAECNFTVTVNDTEPPVIVCPPAVTLCYSNAGDSIGFAAATDNCGIAGITSDRGQFVVGENLVTYTATDLYGNTSTCVQVVTLSSPIAVEISADLLPEFCQGEGMMLMANVGGSDAVAYLWSNGGVSEESFFDVTYNNTWVSVTVTNAWGCQASAQYYLSFDETELLSSYLMLTRNHIKLEGTVINSGGLGVKEGKSDKLEAKKFSFVTAPGTFAKAQHFHIDNSSVITNTYNASPAVAWPVFETYAGNNTGINVHIPDNVTMTLSLDIYREVKVGKNATAIFTQPVIDIEKGIKMDDGATLQFPLPCTKIRMNDKLDGNKNININPDENFVLFYIDDDVHLDGGALVNGVFYLGSEKSKDTVKHHMHIADSKGRTAVFKGMFLAECVHSGKNSSWYLGDVCNNCLFPKAQSFAADDQLNSQGVVINSYPNPFETMTTLAFTLPEDNHVKMDVFDVSGKLITQLYEGTVTGGQEYRVVFDGAGLPSGIYIYRMTTNEDAFTGKITLIKH